MFMAIMIAAFSMVACSSDSREDEVPDNPQDKKTTLADYEGVWENGNDDMFFSVTSDGYVLYNLWECMLGRGKGTLRNDTLIVKNEYSKRTDSLVLYKPVEDQLAIRGKVFGKNTGKAYNANGLYFSLNKEKVPIISFAGDYWTTPGGLNAYFGSFDEKYIVLNDYVFQRQISYKSGRYETREYYYVPREINSKSGTRRLYYAGYKDDEVVHYDYFPSR